MNLFQVAWWNVQALRRRLLGLVAMVAVVGAVCLSAIGIASNAQGTTTSKVGESTANRSVTVDSPDGGPDTARLTEATEKRLAGIAHVESVQHRLQVSMPVRDNPEGADLLYATTYREALTPPVVKSVRKQLFPLHRGGGLPRLHTRGGPVFDGGQDGDGGRAPICAARRGGHGE